MVSALYIVAFAATFAVLAEATDYCNLSSCRGRPHTICKYGLLSVNHRQCGQIQSSALTQAEIQSILQRHNEYRAKVARGDEHRGSPGPQPAARNLQPLQWDDELAKIAQTWANQCSYGHDDCSNTETLRTAQSIAQQTTWGLNEKPDWNDLVKLWYDEVELLDRRQIENFTSPGEAGHYLNIVKEATTSIGCGGVRYSRDGKYLNHYLVCNYGPPGGYANEPIYRTR